MLAWPVNSLASVVPVDALTVLGGRVEYEARWAPLLVTLQPVVGALHEHLNARVRVVVVAAALERRARVTPAGAAEHAAHAPRRLDRQNACREQEPSLFQRTRRRTTITRRTDRISI